MGSFGVNLLFERFLPTLYPNLNPHINHLILLILRIPESRTPRTLYRSLKPTGALEAQSLPELLPTLIAALFTLLALTSIS